MVELAADRTGQRVHLDVRCRGHVAGQPVGHTFAQPRRVADDVRDEASYARGVLADDDGSLRHRLGQDRLDLTQLDPVPPDLHLTVRTTRELQHTIGIPAGQITRPVHPPATERVGHETLGRQPRPIQIAVSQTRTGDVQLTAYARWDGPQRRVEHVRADVVQLVRPPVRTMPAIGIHRRLGRPVQVMTGQARRGTDPPPQAGIDGLTADQQHLQSRVQQPGRDEFPQIGRRHVQYVKITRGGHYGLVVPIVLQHVQRVPVEHPQQRLPRTVEHERRHMRHPKPAPSGLHQPRPVGEEQVRQALVRHDHALGPAGRTGRVDHIRRARRRRTVHGRAVRQTVEVLLPQDEGGRGVLQHERPPIRGLIGIQRKIGRTGLQHTQ